MHLAIKKNLVVFNLVDFCNSPNCQNKFYTKFSSYTVYNYVCMDVCVFVFVYACVVHMHTHTYLLLITIYLLLAIKPLDVGDEFTILTCTNKYTYCEKQVDIFPCLKTLRLYVKLIYSMAI